MAPLLAQRQRSDRAFEKLYQRHVGDVYRYALVVMRNPADAEDVTQTTFLNAYRAYARGEHPRTPQNWLIAIAHNVCRQRFRQQQRRPNELPLELEIAQTVPDEETPNAEDIRRALSHLAFNQRAALVMRELEGRSYAEIAEVLQVSTSAVETLIFRARRALREQLEGGLTCREAEFAISKQLDGKLGRRDKGALRAHLRECADCARFARSQRAQRSAIRSLALIPVPGSLSSFFHHGGAAASTGAAAGTGAAVKVALVGATAIVATAGGVVAARQAGFHPLRAHHIASAQASPARTPPARSLAAAEAPKPATPVGGPSPTGSAPRQPRPRPIAAAAGPRPAEPKPTLTPGRGRVSAPGQLRARATRPERSHRAGVAPGRSKQPRTNAHPRHAVPVHPPKPAATKPPPAKGYVSAPATAPPAAHGKR
ncbi:MAG TPA: sigma-70 family RNA polymerase sigma factor [Gaiellaceae bacterium]